ncbi:preprotein translocase subunit SecE [Candidatus Peregrinibacteria bacterium]|nr:preprotein translocase subunit SecE [Candidatus Peregrinibacteria bacterium]
MKNYLKNSFEELTKVTWPTKNQAVKLTIIVLIFCIITALFLGVVDYLFNQGYNYLLRVAGRIAPPSEIMTEETGGIDISNIELEEEAGGTIDAEGLEIEETDTTDKPTE